MSRADQIAAPRRVVISWIRANRRSKGLAEALDAEAFFMPWARSGGSLPVTVVGWARSAVRTLATLVRLPRGSAAVMMVPPVWAPMIAMLFKRRLRIAFDIHSAAFNHKRWRWSTGLLTFLIRRADAVIVTNLFLLQGRRIGSTELVVLTNPSLYGAARDLTPSVFPSAGPIPTAVFPASGEDDEPLDEVAAAAALLAGEVRLVATGKLPARLASAGLELSGFLPDDEYEDLMNTASVVLALTTREATNQRSAAEAIARAMPLVCSDTVMLRSTYGDAAIMVLNDAKSIAEGVRLAIAQRSELQQKAVELRRRLIDEADAAVAALVVRLIA